MDERSESEGSKAKRIRTSHGTVGRSKSKSKVQTSRNTSTKCQFPDFNVLVRPWRIASCMNVDTSKDRLGVVSICNFVLYMGTTTKGMDTIFTNDKYLRDVQKDLKNQDSLVEVVNGAFDLLQSRGLNSQERDSLHSKLLEEYGDLPQNPNIATVRSIVAGLSLDKKLPSSVVGWACGYYGCLIRYVYKNHKTQTFPPSSLFYPFRPLKGAQIKYETKGQTEIFHIPSHRMKKNTKFVMRCVTIVHEINDEGPKIGIGQLTVPSKGMVKDTKTKWNPNLVLENFPDPPLNPPSKDVMKDGYFTCLGFSDQTKSLLFSEQNQPQFPKLFGAMLFMMENKFWNKSKRNTINANAWKEHGNMFTPYVKYAYHILAQSFPDSRLGIVVDNGDTRELLRKQYPNKDVIVVSRDGKEYVLVQMRNGLPVKALLPSKFTKYTKEGFGKVIRKELLCTIQENTFQHLANKKGTSKTTRHFLEIVYIHINAQNERSLFLFPELDLTCIRFNKKINSSIQLYVGACMLAQRVLGLESSQTFAQAIREIELDIPTDTEINVFTEGKPIEDNVEQSQSHSPTQFGKKKEEEESEESEESEEEDQQGVDIISCSPGYEYSQPLFVVPSDLDKTIEKYIRDGMRNGFNQSDTHKKVLAYCKDNKVHALVCNQKFMNSWYKLNPVHST